MFRGSVLGQDIISLLLFPRRYGSTGFEAEAVVSGFQDVAAVGETVEERSLDARTPSELHARGPQASSDLPFCFLS
jgi:hypothetical protein